MLHLQVSRTGASRSVLLLIWDGQSRGSAMMLDIARKKGLRVYEIDVTRKA